MPLLEDAPKKNFKLKRRNSWDVASILDSTSEQTVPEDSTQSRKVGLNLGQTQDNKGENLGQTEDKPRTSESVNSRTNLGQKLSEKPRTNLGHITEKYNLANDSKITKSSNPLKDAFDWSPKSEKVAESDKPRTNLGQDPIKEPGSELNQKIVNSHSTFKKDETVNLHSGLSKIELNLSVSKSTSTFEQPRTNLGQDLVSSNNVTEDKLRTRLTRKTRDKVRTSGTDVETENLGQSEDKVSTMPSGSSDADLTGPSFPNVGLTKIAAAELHLSNVIGLQRKILFLIFDSTRISRTKESGAICIQNVATQCVTSVMSVRKTIQRMESRGLIFRAEFKNGRGGWTKYTIPNVLYAELLSHESEPPLVNSPTETNFRATPTTNLITYSNSVEASDIDIAPVSNIGFKPHHIRELLSLGVLSKQELQDSLHMIAFDIEVNGKLKAIKGRGGPFSFFFGILRKAPYTPPDNYESPRTRRVRLHRELKEKEQQRVDSELLKIHNLEFESWLKKLSPSDVAELAPISGSDTHKRAQLCNYFDDKVWPLKRSEVARDLSN